ncbi:Ig-like domain-containing protein [Vibrio chagasii]|nr:Ig-like domain-containing protein [Vibrio chagasii]
MFDETTAGITVLEVNDPPAVKPTSYTIDEDSVLTFSGISDLRMCLRR